MLSFLFSISNIQDSLGIDESSFLIGRPHVFEAFTLFESQVFPEGTRYSFDDTSSGVIFLMETT